MKTDIDGRDIPSSLHNYRCIGQLVSSKLCLLLQPSRLRRYPNMRNRRPYFPSTLSVLDEMLQQDARALSY